VDVCGKDYRDCVKEAVDRISGAVFELLAHLVKWVNAVSGVEADAPLALIKVPVSAVTPDDAFPQI
jgi:hypothetical protein